jgi:hypothetical protein
MDEIVAGDRRVGNPKMSRTPVENTSEIALTIGSLVKGELFYHNLEAVLSQLDVLGS